jgi:hypothetical protein
MYNVMAYARPPNIQSGGLVQSLTWLPTSYGLTGFHLGISSWGGELKDYMAVRTWQGGGCTECEAQVMSYLDETLTNHQSTTLHLAIHIMMATTILFVLHLMCMQAY